MLLHSLLPGRAGPSPEDSHSSEEQPSFPALLEGHTLAEGLSPKELGSLTPSVRFKAFQDEEIVCNCPDANHDAFVLLRGVVAITRKKDQLLYTVEMERPGAAFNLHPLLGLTPDRAGAKALGSVELLAFDSAILSKILENQPRLGYKLIRNVGRLALDQCERQMDKRLE